MPEPVVLRVETEHSVAGRKVGGADAAILVLPPELKVNGALLLVPTAQILRRVAEAQAANLGEVLHHAEFVLTRSKAEIEARNMHDCDECRAGTRRAFRLLDEDPHVELLVGNLYWVEPE